MFFSWVRCLQNKRGFATHTTSFSWTPSPHHNVEQRRSTERLATNPRLFCSTLHSLISVLLSTLWLGNGGCAVMRILKRTFILQTPVWFRRWNWRRELVKHTVETCQNIYPSSAKSICHFSVCHLSIQSVKAQPPLSAPVVVCRGWPLAEYSNGKQKNSIYFWQRTGTYFWPETC